MKTGHSTNPTLSLILIDEVTKLKPSLQTFINPKALRHIAYLESVAHYSVTADEHRIELVKCGAVEGQMYE
jgi:hypothetical protein